jgi:RNA recognition motif-containing protein
VRKLYVGNIPFKASEADVRAFFHPQVLRDVYLPVDRESGRPRGFAFVQIEDGEAGAATARLNGADFGGRTAVVSEALEKGEHRGRPAPPSARRDRDGRERRGDRRSRE